MVDYGCSQQKFNVSFKEKKPILAHRMPKDLVKYHIKYPLSFTFIKVNEHLDAPRNIEIIREH